MMIGEIHHIVGTLKHIPNLIIAVVLGFGKILGKRQQFLCRSAIDIK
jgi:hypothetical protein